MVAIISYFATQRLLFHSGCSFQPFSALCAWTRYQCSGLLAGPLVLPPDPFILHSKTRLGSHKPPCFMTSHSWFYPVTIFWFPYKSCKSRLLNLMFPTPLSYVSMTFTPSMSPRSWESPRCWQGSDFEDSAMNICHSSLWICEAIDSQQVNI